MPKPNVEQKSEKRDFSYSNESGSLLIKFIAEQEQIVMNGLLSAFKASASRFFKGDSVEIDRVSADRGKAKSRVTSGDYHYLKPKGVLNVKFDTPKYSEVIPFNFEAGKNIRIAGVGATDEIDKEAQLFAIFTDRTTVLLNRVARGLIWQAANIYQTGKIPFSKEDLGCPDADFGFDTALFAPISIKWANADGTPNQSANPVTDIAGRIKLLRSKSGVSKVMIVFTPSALDVFIRNEKVIKWADGIENKFLQITDDEKYQMDGYDFIGKYNFNGRKIPFYTYDENYTDDDEKQTIRDYLTDGQVLILPVNQGKYSIAYGGIDAVAELDSRLKNISPTSNITIFGDKKAVDIWLETVKVASGVGLALTSRPILIPESVNTHGSFNVLP